MSEAEIGLWVGLMLVSLIAVGLAVTVQTLAEANQELRRRLLEVLRKDLP